MVKLSDNHPEKWAKSNHSKVKHILLEKYIGAWVRVIGKWSRQLLYVDGFAGRNEYIDGSPGSPSIAINTFAQISNLNSEVICFFVENDKENFSNLKKTIEQHELPENVKAHCKNDRFDTAINTLLDRFDERHVILPSFYFIDPFGYTGIPFSTIQRLLSKQKSEVFINFMIRDVHRFLTHPNQGMNFDELFGCSNWKDLIDEKERRNALLSFYINRLLLDTGAKYCIPFKFCEDEKNSEIYYMIYATGHFKGLDIMKDIMAKQNANFAFLGPKEYEYQQTRYTTLYNNEEEQVRNMILNEYKGKIIGFDALREETWYLPIARTTYNKVCRALEKEGSIRVNRISSAKTGIKEKDQIVIP